MPISQISSAPNKSMRVKCPPRHSQEVKMKPLMVPLCHSQQDPDLLKLSPPRSVVTKCSTVLHRTRSRKMPRFIKLRKFRTIDQAQLVDSTWPLILPIGSSKPRTCTAENAIIFRDSVLLTSISWTPRTLRRPSSSSRSRARLRKSK